MRFWISLRPTVPVSGCCVRAVSARFPPILKGQRKTRTKASWNLLVKFCGAKRKMNPVSINQVNNIRLETFICFLAIIVCCQFFTISAICAAPIESFPPVFVVVHCILPQLQVFQIDTGSPSDAAQRIIDNLDLQAGRIGQNGVHSPQQ